MTAEHNVDPMLVLRERHKLLSAILRIADLLSASTMPKYRIYLSLEIELKANGFDIDAAYDWYYGAPEEREDRPQRFDSECGNWTDPRFRRDAFFLFGNPDGDIAMRKFPFNMQTKQHAEFYSDTHPEVR